MTPLLLSPVWYSMHPMVVHFPIALLLVTPLFILIGAALPPARGRPYMIVALMLLALGTAGLFVAFPTGQTAAATAPRSQAAGFLLQTHQALASETRLIFAVLFVIDLGVVLIPAYLHRPESRLFSTVLPLSFLLLYSAGAVFLINTAHAGDMLVHGSEVHPNSSASQIQPGTTEAPGN